MFFLFFAKIFSLYGLLKLPIAIHMLIENAFFFQALPVLYRAIGSKLLPMDGSVLVHFDSHPDLLIPRDLQAPDVYDKHRLFE